MIAPPVSATQSLARAILVSVAPKSIGSGFRVKDDWNAPGNIKRDSIIREGFTLAQIAGLSVLIDRTVKSLETAAVKSLQKKPSPLLAAALKKFQGNQALFLVLLSCVSNFTAETVSRWIAPRDIWEKPLKGTETHKHCKKDDDDDEDRKPNRATGTSTSISRPVPLQPLTFSNLAANHNRPISAFSAAYPHTSVSSSRAPAIPGNAFSL